VVGVDITQGVGLLPFSVTSGADFVVSTSLKWLCGAPGAGIVYVAPSLLAGCEPEFRGWFSQDNPFSWDLTKFRFADDARRFDHGTPSIVSAAASLPGLRWLAETGIDTVRAHNRALGERIMGHARERGWTIASPLRTEERGGSVMIAVPHDTDARSVVAALRGRQLYCDARGATLRLSPGPVTSDGDVDALCDAMDDLLR
jgi:selenocysteine lyase/cysteine desulfurase